MPARNVPDDIWQSFSSDQLASRSQAMLDGLKQKFTDAMAPPTPSSTALAPSTGLPSLDALMSPFAPAARSLGASAVSGQMPDGSSPAPDDSSPPYTPTMSSPATSGLPSFQALPALGSLVQSAMPSMSSAAPSTAASRQPSLTTGPTPSAAPLTIDHSSPQAFLGGLSTAATSALQRHNLPTSLAPILAAIPMNEQGWQKDAPGQNYYGIKGSNPRTGANTGPVGTWEDYGAGRQNIQDTFRAYNDPSESVDDFLSFLESNPRYSKALDVARQTGDPAGFIRAVHAAGYATDPAWSDKILSIAKTVPQTPAARQPALTSAPPTPGEPGGPPLATTYRPLPTATGTASGAPGGLDADGIVKAYSGTSYTYGGPGGRTAGFGAPSDCSGFVSAIYQHQYGLDLVPHTDGAYNQLKQLGAPEVKTQDARPGDVVFYMGAGTGGAITHHMGVYAGDGKVLDDSVSGQDGVHVRDVGHAGQYVILRDPRLNTQTPQSASAPPPIQPSGLAEQTGGAKVNQQQLAQAATSQPGVAPWQQAPPAVTQPSAPPDPPLTSTDSASVPQPMQMLRQPLSMTTLDQSQAPTWQDDQTQSGYVQPDMAPGPPIPDMTGTAPQAPESPWRPPDATASPLKPVYDLAGTVTGYVHTGLGAASDAASSALGYIRDQAPTVADQARGITPTGETPLHAAAGAIGAGVEESMQPGQSLLDAPARLQGQKSADVGDLPELPEPYRSYALTARRAGVQLTTLAMPTAVAEHLWTAAGLPNVNIAGFEINPGMFLVPVPSGIGGTLENRAAGGITAGAVNRIPDIAGAIESGGSRATGAVLGAVRSGIGRVGQALDTNAARVAALDAERAASGQGSTVAASAFGSTPDLAQAADTTAADTSRFYHGTSSAFEQANADKFSKDGLYGPGYYLTDNPEVASSYAADRNYGPGGITPLSNLRTARLQDDIAQAQRVLDNPRTSAEDRAWYTRRIADSQAELDRVSRQGPNVRPLDVPNDLNLLDVRDPAPEPLVGPVNRMREAAGLPPLRQGATGNDLYYGLQEAYPTGSLRAVNTFLQDRGVDGIAHDGGLIRPLADANGEPIRHQVKVIFPDALPRIRQAYSGDYGGAALGQAPSFPGQRPTGSGFFDRATPILSQGVASAVSGGVGAATADQLGDPNDPNRRLKGFVAGAAVPFLAARGARALARAAGREAPEAEGALASFGASPHYKPPSASQVAAEADKGAVRGERLNRDVNAPPSSVPWRTRLATAATDPSAALRYAEDLLSETAGTPRMRESDPLRPSTQARVNAGSVAHERIQADLEPAVVNAAQHGLHSELPQHLEDMHQKDILDEFYNRGYSESMATSQERIAKAQANNRPADIIQALQDKAQQDADLAGLSKMRTRQGKNPDMSYEEIDARLKGQEQRLKASGQWDALQQSAQQVWDHNAETRQRLVDAGELDPDKAAYLAQAYPHYVPTVPISHLDARGGGVVASGGAPTVSRGSQPVVRALEDVGTSGERLNPIVASRNSTVLAERAIQRNNVASSFAQMMDDALHASPGTMGTTGEHRTFLGGGTDITFMANGKPQTISVPKSVADGLQAASAMSADPGTVGRIWKQVMGTVTSAMTAGRASFLPVNVTRDMLDYAQRTATLEGGPQRLPGVMGTWLDEASKAASDIARAQVTGRGAAGAAIGAASGAAVGDENTTVSDRLRHAAEGGVAGAFLLGANRVRPTGDAAEFLARGGGSGGLSGHFGAGQRWYRDMARTGGAPIRSAADAAHYLGDWAKDVASLQGIKGINERAELISRTAAMRRGESVRGLGPTESMIAGRDASYDPDRAGVVARAVNGIVPFFNASVQNAAQTVRLFRDNPAAATATMVATVAPVMLAAEAWNRSDPQRAAVYDDVPQYLKDTGLVVVTPWAGSDARGDRPNYIWIPTGVQTPMVAGMRRAMQDVVDIPGLEPSSGTVGSGPDASSVEKWGNVLNTAVSMFSPIRGDTASSALSNLVPQGVKQGLEVANNRDFYRGTPIVSGPADERASALSQGVAGAANAAGRTFGNDFLQEVHPSQVEHLLGALPAYSDIASGASDLAAPGGYKQAEDRPVANEPFLGGIASRFIRDTGGANLTRAQDEHLPDVIRPALEQAGMRPSDVQTVPSSYKGAPLTRDEQERWQSATNALLPREVLAATRSSEWRAPDADKEQLLRDAMAKARADAAARAMPRVDDREVERRKRIDAARKAG